MIFAQQLSRRNERGWCRLMDSPLIISTTTLTELRRHRVRVAAAAGALFVGALLIPSPVESRSDWGNVVRHMIFT